MHNHKPDVLPTAVRVYPLPKPPKPKKQAKKKRGKKTGKAPHRQAKWKRPKGMVIFDVETRIDATQSMTFGSAQLYRGNRCLEEWIAYGDDLPGEDRRVLEEYVATHRARTAPEGCPELKLLTRREFVEKLFIAAYKCRYLLVAFNFTFDAARIGSDFGYARGKTFGGGFTIHLASYRDENGKEQPSRHRPSFRLKKIDSKRSIKSFTGRMTPDEADLIPEGSETGEPDPRYIFPGHFLDARTLAFALTNESHSLKSACKAFGVKREKLSVEKHGIVTPEYIDYNRRDVDATAELAIKLLAEFEKHPIDLAPTMAYSPASIGKAYLRKMGIDPVLERQPKFPKRYLGCAQSAFFGGRTSAHIRRVPVPVVYCDFLSMYPTVILNMDLWHFVTAGEITVKPCKREIQRFLRNLKPMDLFADAPWKNMAVFVRVIPDGDILPCRAKYSVKTKDWQVGVNYLYGTDGDMEHALWYSLPDILASVILTGKIPKIIDAFRLHAVGKLSTLKPVYLRGRVPVDPLLQDFFKVAIEERKLSSRRTDIPESEKKWLDTSLKCLSNSTGFGIYGQMNRLETQKKIAVTCYGRHGRSYECTIANPEKPGPFCFPPLASLITAGARLMLALLEYRVRELGGTYAMEDTDSMAIVATESGGLIPCPGGPYRTKQRKRAVKALSFEQVRDLSESFRPLTPYNPDAISESVLKIEKDNFDPKTGDQRQLYCLAISAKRYVLFTLDETGNPVLLRTSVNNKEDKWSEHGLGHLQNPENPEDRTWIGQVWENIVREAYGLPPRPLSFARLPAVGQIPISSREVMERFETLNAGKPYEGKIKPYNFVVTCHVKELGHPIGTNPEEFHLFGAYEPNSRKWLKMSWIDQYSGKTFRITTQGNHGTRTTARVKTYGDVIRQYAFHPEAKCADANGNVCDQQTVGLLQRRHIQIGYVKGIGKETNNLDDAEAGLLHSEDKVYTEYPDPQHDEWETQVLPVLKVTPANDILKIAPTLSRRMLMYTKAGKRPHRRNQQLIVVALKTLGRL